MESHVELIGGDDNEEWVTQAWWKGPPDPTRFFEKQSQNGTKPLNEKDNWNKEYNKPHRLILPTV
jgi:hypothetical protein